MLLTPKKLKTKRKFRDEEIKKPYTSEREYSDYYDRYILKMNDDEELRRK